MIIQYWHSQHCIGHQQEDGMTTPLQPLLTLTRAQLRDEQERIRRTNPLGIMCADCFSLCVLSESGKRWNCPNGHDNEVVNVTQENEDEQ